MNVAMELSKDRRIAASVALGTATIACLILHFFTYQIPMPPLPDQLKYEDMEVEFIELTPESLPETVNAGGGGGGDEVNAPQNDKYMEQTQEVLTSKGGTSGKIYSGKSNHTNGTNNTNGPSTKNPKPKSPFGDGGSGDGDGGGDGNGLGVDTGNGHDQGDGGNGSGNVIRSLIRRPNADNIDSDEDCKITFSLKVNADGTVQGWPVVNRNKTTTTNADLISKVAGVVKAQARYNEVKGAKVANIEIVIRLEAR